MTLEMTSNTFPATLSTGSNFTRWCTNFQLHELLENDNLASPESLYLEVEMRGGGPHCKAIDDRGLGGSGVRRVNEGGNEGGDLENISRIWHYCTWQAYSILLLKLARRD